MNFFDCVSFIPLEKFKDLTLLQPEINNVLRGISDELCFYTYNPDDNIFQHIYVNYKNEYHGYMLTLEYGSDEYFASLFEFSVQLCVEFSVKDPVQTINTYLQQVRTAFEKFGINTVSVSEWNRVNFRFKDPNPQIIAPYGFEVIPFFTHAEFYTQILKLNRSAEIKGDTKYVYVMLNTANGLFKIGFSKNPVFRESTLQSKEPEVLLLAYWEGDKRMENKLHAQYVAKRVRGEWFQLNYNDLLEIRKSMSS